jgi:hypothetical protein
MALSNRPAIKMVHRDFQTGWLIAFLNIPTILAIFLKISHLISKSLSFDSIIRINMERSPQPPLDPDWANAMVKCPWPGQEHQEERPLGEFMQTEVGERVLAPYLETAKLLVNNAGMDKFDALKQALPGAIVTDEEGNIKWAEPPIKAEPTDSWDSLGESKKK